MSVATEVASVVNDYQTYLGRTPSQAEVSFWVKAEQHSGVAAVQKDIIASTEYQGLQNPGNTLPNNGAGSGGSTGTLTGGMNTGSGGVAGTPAGGANKGGQISTGQPKNDFISSNIYTNYIGGTLGLQAFVDGLYYTILHVAPDAPSATNYVNQLESGSLKPYQVTNDILAQATSIGITAPSPFPGGANTYTDYLGGPIAVESFVNGLYYDVLNHAPDPAGAAYWVGRIEGPHGLRPSFVTDAFFQSAEFHNIYG